MEDNINHRQLDRMLGIFFFACNIPFVIVESIHFINFVRALNPHYVPPTRKTLSNAILNDCHSKLEESITNMRMQVNDAVLLIDGWKNKAANTQNVVAMLRLDAIENRKYVYLKCWNFSTLSETGEALRVLVNECIGIAREKYNITIFAVITDNASNMIKMGKLVNIWHVTCNSHSGNLLAKSSVDNEFARKVNNLLKDFKKSTLEARLLQQGGNRIVLIAETRWCSHRDAFRRCLRNLNLMREIAREHPDYISQENYDFLFDPTLEMQLQDNTMMLDPICELTNSCQSADCTLADATELWLKLEVPGLNNEINQQIWERREKAINTYGLAANFLHPQYRGRRFIENQEYVNKMNTFFRENLTEQGLMELEYFKNGAGIFRNLLNRNYHSGLIFWKAAQLIYPELSGLAIKLHLICASTGQLERLFSEWAYVHSTKRNRLTSTRSSKLVSIYYDSRLHDNVMMNYLIDNEMEDEDEEF